MSRVLTCLVAVSLLSTAAEAQDAAGIAIGIAEGFNLQIGPLGPPVRDAAPPAIGQSTIRGRIVSTEGQAVRRATVRINASELKGTRTALTDVDGRYEFRDLPAGRYSINASKATFVNWAYGQTQFGTAAKPLVLGDNQVADALNIRLPRGGVIAGRITDDLGEPVPNAVVVTLRPQFIQGQRRLLPGAGRATTNDIGEYRIFGLSPGQYYVSATMPQQAGFGPPNVPVEGPEARNGYAPTFYPGTADKGSAQKLAVGLSQTVSEINLVLLATRTATVSGFAVDAQGQPLSGGFVNLIERGTMGGGGTGGQLRGDGTFTIPNVPPGEYLLRALRPPQGAAGRGPGGGPGVPPDVVVGTVSVNGEDVAGVRLAPLAVATVSGRVSFDDAAAASSLKPSGIRIATQVLGDEAVPGAVPGGPPPTLQDDFTFELKAPAGRVALRAIVAGAAPAAPNGWQVKAVRVNGVDVTDSGVDITSEGVRGVEIELTNHAPEISGGVSDGRGGSVKEYVVLLFAQDRARRTAPFNRYIALVRPGDDGRFKFTALPPGAYFAIALDRADATQWQDPEFLEALSAQASRVSLAQGETATMDLKLFALQ